MGGEDPCLADLVRRVHDPLGPMGGGGGGA